MFVLPSSCIVDKVIPKNSFEKYTTPKQKKLFAEYVEKIKWANKLSKQTVNLDGKDISEIQIFEIHLKTRHTAEDILNIIDKYIPYHIIFVLHFDKEIMYSVAQKHPNPKLEDNSVIDWRFNSNWLKVESDLYNLNLKNSLDCVFTDFCLQISGKIKTPNQSLKDIIDNEKKKNQILIEIKKLESQLTNCKQFNLKVELNLKLNTKKTELKNLLT